MFGNQDGHARGCPRPVAGRSLRPCGFHAGSRSPGLRQGLGLGGVPRSIKALSACDGMMCCARAGGPGKHQPTEVGQAGAPFDCRARCPARASGRRPWPGDMAGCHAQHQKPEVSKRLALDGHSPVTAARCHVSRVFSIGPVARGRRGPAACRWYWRRATSCHWRSAAEVRRASAAWTAASAAERFGCPAGPGC